MTEKLYTQREVSAIFSDVPNKTLIFWARQGLVEWQTETRDARGISRLYNYWNLFQFGLVRELTGMGFSIESIRYIMEAMFKDRPEKKRPIITDEGEEVEPGLPSEFFTLGYMPAYFIILKGASERGLTETKIEMIAFSNFSEDDPVQFSFGRQENAAEQKPMKLGDTIITAYIILSLVGIKTHLNECIEKANLN